MRAFLFGNPQGLFDKKCKSYLNQRLNKFHFALSRVVGIHLKEIHEYDCFVSHWFTSVTVEEKSFRFFLPGKAPKKSL